MTNINIYPAQERGWIYVVWFAERPIIVGWCETRAQAEEQAALM